jgi:hypothetical protein
VNLEAGEWAMEAGRVAGGMEAYRWALEEYRLVLFASGLASKPALTAAEMDRLWAAATRAG